MDIKTIQLFDIPITIESKDQILEYVEKYLQKGKRQKSRLRQGYGGQAKGKSEEIEPMLIFTQNPEIIVQSGRDKTLNKILRRGDINLTDGAGIVWAAKFLHNRHIERIPGVEMMRDIVKLAAKKGYSMLLIGGGPGVAVETLECLRRTNSGLEGSVIEAIFVSVEGEKLVFTDKCGKTLDTIGQIKKIVSIIEKNEIKVVFVGLGCPKQEYLIKQLTIDNKHLTFERPIVFMAVGGSFDYISGRVPRAPQFMQDLGLEWLYRLVRQPWRIGRMIAGGEFFLRVMLGNRH